MNCDYIDMRRSQKAEDRGRNGAGVTRREWALAAGAGVLGAAALRAQAPAAEERITARIADFIVRTKYADLSDELIALGKKSILDGLGLALVGSVANSGAILRSYLAEQRIGDGGATVIGSPMKLTHRFAAFANGIGIHADDYDDTQLAVAPDRVYGLLTHPTAPCLAAALALGEVTGASGRDFMLAYHVGVEVECKIAEAISPRHYQDGFHTTATVGPFAAAAAATKLYFMDALLTARALGLAASQSAGLRENFGTMTKPFHAGHAAESGLVAADLVAHGWTASDQILEAPSGFFHAAGGGYDPRALSLAHPWTFVSPGVSIKPYPSGSLTHPAMTALLRLIREHDIKPDQVERVDVGTNRNMPNALIHHHPTDSLQAKFSMEFCMASLLLYRKAGLNEFTDEVVRRPEVQAMIERVRFGVHPEAEKAGYNKMTSIVEVRLRDGRALAGRADIAKGNPGEPMSFAEVTEKFHECARFAKWRVEKTRGVVDAVTRLEDLPNLRLLTRNLAL